MGRCPSAAPISRASTRESRSRPHVGGGQQQLRHSIPAKLMVAALDWAAHPWTPALRTLSAGRSPLSHPPEPHCSLRAPCGNPILLPHGFIGATAPPNALLVRDQLSAPSISARSSVEALRPITGELPGVEPFAGREGPGEALPACHKTVASSHLCTERRKRRGTAHLGGTAAACGRGILLFARSGRTRPFGPHDLWYGGQKNPPRHRSSNANPNFLVLLFRIQF